MNALPMIAGWRLGRRVHGTDTFAVLADAALVYFFVQYLAIGLPGMLGVLGPGAILLTTALVSGAVWWVGSQIDSTDTPGHYDAADRWSILFIACGGRAFVIAILETVWTAPPLANDPLTYHLPAAVHWLQQGSLARYETWYYNPANTFSPLAGSMFLAWWMAPLGNDILARFGQAPALVLIAAATLRLCRDLGAPRFVPAMLALSVVLCRPIISQAQIAKDDLFLAAFFLAALSSLTRAALTDPLGVVRLGVAIGLLGATKYTAAYALPILLLAIDAPWRAGWRWRSYGVAIWIALLLVGPWLIRNTIATGNPFYPLAAGPVDGPLSLGRDPSLGSLAGLWTTVVTSYYGTTTPLAIGLMIAWSAASFRFALNPTRNEALARAVVLGPLAVIIIYTTTAPYPEGRFALPAILAMMVTPALLGRWGIQWSRVAWGLSVGLLIVSASTSFIPDNLSELIPITAFYATLIVVLTVMLQSGIRHPRTRGATVVIASLVVIAVVYVYWNASVQGYRARIADLGAHFWGDEKYYGDLAAGWLWVRSELPAGSTIALVNSHFTYPLYNFDLSNRIVQFSSRPDVADLTQLPALPRRIPGDRVIPLLIETLRTGADPSTFLQRLDASGAGVVFVDLQLQRRQGPPPELVWMRSMPERFQVLYENPGCAVFRVVR